MAKQPCIQILPDAATLARVAADAVVRCAQEAIVTRGQATVALSGGATPQSLYQRLAGPPNSTRLDFSAIHFFFADERCVPPDDGQSNYQAADRLLFGPAGVPADHVHRIRGELAPAQAAAEYQRELRRFFDGPWPAFDLVLLGVGADGHTASLFAGSAALAERTAWVTTAQSPLGVRDRVTLTLPAIRHAGNVIFLASGRDKRDAIAAAIGRAGGAAAPGGGVAPGNPGSPAPADSPAAAVAPLIAGQLRWLLDADAAGGIAG